MAGFRKNKRKKPFTPPTAATVNPNAATAATAAFNLSSAAAGAALRALPAPKTNVAEVQTKRTMRRSASVSSQGSRRALSPVPSIKRMMGMGGRGAADGGPIRSAAPPPTLRRRGSASSLASMASVTSMSERTFRTRTPSPGRAARGSAARAPSIPSSPGSSIASGRTPTVSTAITAAGAAAAAAIGRTGKGNRSQSMPPPPVPSIPKHVTAAATPAKQQQKQARKSLQLAQQPLRLASEQQQAKAASGRSSWFGGATVGNMGDVRKSDVAMDISNYKPPGNKVSITPPDERPSSRASSINFSYPSRQRLASPPASPTTADTPVAPPPASQVVSRSMSSERIPTQNTAPRHKQAHAGASGRRSVSMSRVTDRTTATHASGQTLVYDPNSRRFVPREELLLEQSLVEAAEQSERQQHKKQQRHSVSAASLAGSRLAQEVSPKAHKTATSPKRQPETKQPEPKQHPAAPKPEAVAAPSPPRQQKQQRRPQSKRQSQSHIQDAPQVIDEQLESALSPSESAKTVSLPTSSQTNTESAVASGQADADDALDADSGRPALVKRPSVVREETEREIKEERRPRPTKSSAALTHETESPRSPARNDAPTVAVQNGQDDNNSINLGGRLSVRRHSPPPRSVSPRKSAMKHSSSPRDVSPSDSASDANPTALAPQPTNSLTVQGASARKKAHRVSFDEKAVVVPQEPSQKPSFSSLPGAPESPSSSQRRTWFSNVGRSKKKGVELAAAAAGTAYGVSSLASGQDEDDEIMKPRPALPSFGSVREKAHAPPQEERPLVRPQASAVRTTAARSPTDSPAATPPRGASQSPVADTLSGQHLETQGTSSDHAIGSILVSSLTGPSPEEQSSSAATATRNTANTSRYREPLPPVVTSVDGSGYASDSGASNASDEKETEAALLADDDESEVNIGVDEHTPSPRFDETRTTSFPTVLPAVIDEVPSDEENASAPEPSTADASTAKAPKKAVPAIAITHPSQENLVAVQGHEDEGDEKDSSNAKQAADALSQTPAPPPTRNSPIRAFFDVPGTFPPDSDSDSTNKASPTKATFGLGDSTSGPTRQDAFEPIAQDDDNTVTEYTPSTVYATHMPTLHEESSIHEQSHDEGGRGVYSNNDDDSEDNDKDDESIYSDAYEDLSDAEGGFQSLAAVVDSPISPDSKNQPFALPPVLPNGPPSPKTKRVLAAAEGAAVGTAANGAETYGGNSVAANAWHASKGAGATTNAAGDMSQTKSADDADWEKVRAFWHSLSSERRAQLEREANERAAKEEAAAEGDLEESTVAKKARRKKSAETRLAEKKSLKDMVARNEGPQPVPQPQSQPRSAQQTTPKKISKRLRPSMRETAAGVGAGAVVAAAATTTALASNGQPTPPRPQSAGRGAARTGHTRTLSSDSTSSSLLQKQKQGFLSGALRRRGSDSSESSFKRSRGGAQSDVGVSMKRTMRGESLDRGSSRFSLRSLSPTGSATLRGGPGASAQSPHMPRTLRDKPAGRDKSTLSSSMTSATLRSHSVDAGDGGNRILPSLGKKGGSKLVRRGSSSRFGDSSDEDEDIIPRPASAGPASGAVLGASRRSASVGGATRAFRSRFDDSSDEDEVILDSRLRAAARQNRTTQRHMVPKTLRSGGLRGSNSVGGGGLSSKSFRSSEGGRPASRGGGASKRPSLPEALEEEEEEELYRRPMTADSAVRPDAYMLRTPSGNIGTSTVRRSRSGRGQIMSPTLSSTALGGAGGGARSTVRGKDAGLGSQPQVAPSNVQHRRLSSAGSIMSVLRRKKPKDDGVGAGSFGSAATTMKIQRGELSDSAARRDTQLERSKQELALLRSNSQRRRQLQRAGRVAEEDEDDELDSDLDSDAGAGGRPAVNGAKSGGARGAQANSNWPLTDTNVGGSGRAKVSAGNVVANDSDRLPVKKKKFPALRRMFRLDD